MQNITVQELSDVAKKGLTHDEKIIDVRSPSEYRSGYILGAQNIPLQEIEKHIDSLRKYKTLYVHRQHGVRSVKACGQLEALGLDNCINVLGGLSEWERAGFPVERDPAWQSSKLGDFFHNIFGR